MSKKPPTVRSISFNKLLTKNKITQNRLHFWRHINQPFSLTIKKETLNNISEIQVMRRSISLLDIISSSLNRSASRRNRSQSIESLDVLTQPTGTPNLQNIHEDMSNDDDESEEDEDSDPTNLDIHTKNTRNKALLEFRYRVEQAIIKDYLLTKKNKGNSPKANEISKEITLWGVPLLPSAGHEGTNMVLLKFLKAKNYKVHEAFILLRNTLKWRAEFLADGIVEDIVPEEGNLWFSDGRDREGRPLCYSVLGEKCEDYLKWKVQCLEKGIGNLNFRPGEVDSTIQIVDLKNVPGPITKEVKMIYKNLITLLYDHYPGIVYKNLIINVPSWYLTFHALNLRIITKRSRNKFVFVKSSKVTETLLKFATPENILVQYGGLKRENDNEFSTEDKVLELNIRANFTADIEIPINEAEVTVTWDVTVVGYEVTYKEEFIPEDDCSYNILLQKEERMEKSIRHSFSVREPGKIVITIVNGSYKSKKVFYRYKSQPSVPLYMFIKQ